MLESDDDEDIVTIQHYGERLLSGGWLQEQKNHFSSGCGKADKKNNVKLIVMRRLLLPGAATPNTCVYYWVTAPLM